MAEQCRRWDPVTRTPGTATARGFCLPCERHGQFAISELPQDWRKLHTMIAAGGGGFGAGIPTNRVDPPIPLRIGIDNVMREIAWALVTWELPVREVARLSEVAEKQVRPEVEVPRGAGCLVTHYDVLLALPATDYLDYAMGPSTLDGLGAIVYLTRLHHLARSTIGESQLYERRALPCPLEPLAGGCGEYTLVELIGRGSDGLPNPIHCQTCGWVSDADQYAAYARLLIPVGRRPFV